MPKALADWASGTDVTYFIKQELCENKAPGSFYEKVLELGASRILQCSEETMLFSEKTDWFIYTFQFQLTTEGFYRIDQIVSLFFTYIAFIKKSGIRVEIYEADSAIALLNFYFSSYKEL